MRGAYLLLLLALLVSLVALPRPERLSGVRSLDEGPLVLPAYNLSGQVAAWVFSQTAYAEGMAGLRRLDPAAFEP